MMNKIRTSNTTYNRTRVIFLRHGQSTYNQLKLYQGCCDDSLLNDKGKIQAYQSGEFLRNTSIDTIYASPLQRTQETAQQILDAIKADNIDNIDLNSTQNTITSEIFHTPELKIHPNLKEVDIPGWQGLSFEYVRKNLAEDYQVWEERPHEFIMETISISGSTLVKTQIQPVLKLYKQAKEFWQEILPQHMGKTILIVSHGGTIRALIGTALGIKSEYFHTLQQSNCGISTINIENSLGNNNLENNIPKENLYKANLETVNLTQHLGEVLPKLKNGKYGLRLLLLPVNAEDKDIAKISKFLTSVELDFCLSRDTPAAEKTAKSLLEAQSKPPVNIQISRENFLSQWHKIISKGISKRISNQTQNTTPLQTAMVIADPETIISVFNQILELDKHSGQLNIQPNKISILFYPASQNKAVIQAMNISP
ncbi:MAG: histidine phosphatase family protein [Cyanobacteria bacterium P01_A01_bin.45]